MISSHFVGEPDMDGLRAAWSIRTSSPQAALTQLTALAGRGSVMAMVYIGGMYLNGIGVASSITDAEAWYSRAADAGSAFAYFQLGAIRSKRREFSKAAEACRVGAELGYAPCMYRLATMYQDGVGVPKDLQKARDLLEAAVAQGHIYARVRLGGILTRGNFGVLQRVRGIWLGISGTIRAIPIANQTPKDERLYGQ